MGEISVSMEETENAAHIRDLNNYAAIPAQPLKDLAEKWDGLFFGQVLNQVEAKNCLVFGCVGEFGKPQGIMLTYESQSSFVAKGNIFRRQVEAGNVCVSSVFEERQ